MLWPVTLWSPVRPAEKAVNSNFSWGQSQADSGLGLKTPPSPSCREKKTARESYSKLYYYSHAIEHIGGVS